MVARRMGSALLVGLLVGLTGCGSGAAPALPARVEAAAADVPARILDRLRTMSPEAALGVREGWVPAMASVCSGASGDRPALACQWGPGFNAMFDGRALFWWDGSAWQTQTYPEEAVRGVGYFQRLYQHGDELIVIINVAGGMTMGTEQVQVLRFDSGAWRVGWLPAEEDWTRGHAEVTFTAEDYSRFRVETDSYHLSDAERGPFAESQAGLHRPFAEEWERDGNGYRRVGRTEVASEYGALVHFVTALSRGDETEALKWALEPAVVELAKELGVPDSAEQGYIAFPEGSGPNGWGPNGPLFRLEAFGTGEPWWLVRVQRQGDGWVVFHIDQP